MKKWKLFLTGSIMVATLPFFTGCGTGNTNNAADETAIEENVEQGLDSKEQTTETEITTVTEKPTTTTTKEKTVTSTEDTNGDMIPGDGREDDSVSDALGDGARSLGNGVGNTIEDIGDAIDNAFDGR